MFICPSGLGGNVIFSAPIEISVQFLLCRFPSWMSTYSVNILSVCLSVMLQKALLHMNVFILVFFYRKWLLVIFKLPNYKAFWRETKFHLDFKLNQKIFLYHWNNHNVFGGEGGGCFGLFIWKIRFYKLSRLIFTQWIERRQTMTNIGVFNWHKSSPIAMCKS